MNATIKRWGVIVRDAAGVGRYVRDDIPTELEAIGCARAACDEYPGTVEVEVIEHGENPRRKEGYGKAIHHFDAKTFEEIENVRKV